MNEERKRRRWRIYALAFFVVLVVYPLSVGPCFWLALHGYIPVEFYETKIAPTVYAPLSWLSRLCPPFRDLMNWYIQFWIALGA